MVPSSLYRTSFRTPFKAPLFEPVVAVQPLFLREAELKHGRLAMVASLLIPLFDGPTLGIHRFETLPSEIQFGVVTLMFMSEFRTLNLGPEKAITILEDYTPGDFGFELPKPATSVDSELNHGRLAMLGALGMMAHELVTNLYSEQDAN
jgi:hypothetical protein